MVLGVGYGMAMVSVALLVIYGADASVAGMSEGEGFLPMDSMVRGIALGVPSVVLPVIAFVMTRNEPSMGLGGVIIVSGILIAMGGVMTLGGEGDVGMSWGLLGVGGFVAALGAIKIVKSR